MDFHLPAITLNDGLGSALEDVFGQVAYDPVYEPLDIISGIVGPRPEGDTSDGLDHADAVVRPAAESLGMEKPLDQILVGVMLEEYKRREKLRRLYDGYSQDEQVQGDPAKGMKHLAELTDTEVVG